MHRDGSGTLKDISTSYTMSFFPVSSTTPYNHRRPSDATSSNFSAKSIPKSTLAPLFHFIKDPTAALSSAFVLDEAMRRHQLASARLKNATKFADWDKAARELDLLEGNETWKLDPCSSDYDSALVSTRLKQLDDARLSCDIGRMLFLIRTTLSRNLGEMGNIWLYKHSHTGTKRLIEEYINSCLITLSSLLTLPLTADTPTSRQILDTLINTRQAFGRTALLLSGGATFGMSHIGVLKALLEASLLPRIISGASAGSIVAAVLCTRTDDEIPSILNEFPFGNLDVFEDGKNPESVLHRVTRFLKIGAWIDITHLTGVMRGLLGDITFQEAYNRTRRILNICVTSASIYELPHLLNYISAPNVLIWSAVAASCSVPFLFSATSLLSKDPKTGRPVPWNPTPQRWIDGSVENDLPMTRLAEMFNVNHFIVSQVNPHVVPFLSKEDLISPDHTPEPPESTVARWGKTAVKLAMGEVLHIMNMMAEIGVFKTGLTKARSVLSQKYYGDITIFPEVSYADFPNMLKNPTPEFMFQAALRGERATWPKLSRIRNHCAIELALDLVIHKLRTRVVFSPSQADLRLGNFWRASSSNGRGFGAAGGIMFPITSSGVETLGMSGGRDKKLNARRRMRSHDPSALSLWDRSITRGWRSGTTSPVLTRSRSRHRGNNFLTVRCIPSKELEPEGEDSILRITTESIPADTEREIEAMRRNNSILSEDGSFGWSLIGVDSEGEGGDEEDDTHHMANTSRRRMYHHRRPSAPSMITSTRPPFPASPSTSVAPLSSPARRRERGPGKMTPAMGDEGIMMVRVGVMMVKVGMGRAKSAEELRGMI